MADDTAQGGTDVIATDHVTNLNGAAVAQSPTSPKVQRVKVAYGDDGTSRDASDAFPLPVRDVSGTATLTSVAAAVTSTTVIAANPNRRGLILHSTSGSAICYVRLGAAPASSALGGHTFDLPAGGYWEAPFGYTGEVRAIWAATGGGLNVTELT